MPDHLKVGMANPVADRGLGPSEKVIDNSDFMTQEHQTVDEMRSDETGAARDQYTLALKRRQEFDGRETGESGIGDRVGVWMKYGLGLIGCKVLVRLCVRLCRFRILSGEISRGRGGQDIVGAKIKRSEEINGDFAIEAKPSEANRLDFLSRLVQHLDLSR